MGVLVLYAMSCVVRLGSGQLRQPFAARRAVYLYGISWRKINAESFNRVADDGHDRRNSKNCWTVLVTTVIFVAIGLDRLCRRLSDRRAGRAVLGQKRDRRRPEHIARHHHRRGHHRHRNDHLGRDPGKLGIQTGSDRISRISCFFDPVSPVHPV